MSIEQRSKIEDNLPFLERCIDSDSGLIVALYARKCITRQQKNYIDGIPSHDRNSALLDILCRRSAADFIAFIEILNDLGQKHIASVLVEGGGKMFSLL